MGMTHHAPTNFLQPSYLLFCRCGQGRLICLFVRFVIVVGGVFKRHLKPFRQRQRVQPHLLDVKRDVFRFEQRGWRRLHGARGETRARRQRHLLQPEPRHLRDSGNLLGRWRNSNPRANSHSASGSDLACRHGSLILADQSVMEGQRQQ